MGFNDEDYDVGALYNEIMKGASDLILFKVTVTWHDGGPATHLVLAKDAISALAEYWSGEDPTSLRHAEVEWSCPVDCVIGVPQDAADMLRKIIEKENQDE